MRTLVRSERIRVVLITVIVLAAMASATALFGWNAPAPSFDLTVDPAGGMPF